MQVNLINYYQAIERTGSKMLEAAKLQDWDEIVRLEGACAVLIEQLRREAQVQELNPVLRAEKNRLMLSILACDAQIRRLIEPCLDDIGAILQEKRPMFLH